MVFVPLQPAKTEWYVVNRGISYRDKRAEEGDVVDDLLPGEVEWMLADGTIEKADLR